MPTFFVHHVSSHIYASSQHVVAGRAIGERRERFFQAFVLGCPELPVRQRLTKLLNVAFEHHAQPLYVFDAIALCLHRGVLMNA